MILMITMYLPWDCVNEPLLSLLSAIPDIISNNWKDKDCKYKVVMQGLKHEVHDNQRLRVCIGTHLSSHVFGVT